MKNKIFKPQLLIVITIFAVCCLSFGPALHAQTADTTEPADTSAPVDETKPFVASVSSSENAVGLEDEIIVQVTGIRQLLDEAKEKNEKIILFINGLPLKGIYPAFDEEKNGLRFFIDHSDNPIELWNKLTLSRESTEIFTRQVCISVGLENQEPILTNVKNFTLILARKKWFYICVVFLLALLGLFITLAVKSNMLRDIGPNPPDGGKKPYSLAHTQMATWFFFIMSSWLLLYVVKHSFSTITDSLVILMGISAGTGIGGVAIDSSRKTANTVRRSEGFLRDILSDPNGISFHRFQVFAWTVVMVLVFIRQVTAYLVMPEFSTALLTLMGISSGTYLGLKVSEKPETADASTVEENTGSSQTAAPSS